MKFKKTVLFLAILLLASCGQLNAQLVAWWPFDEVETTATGDIWTVKEATGNFPAASVWGWVDLGNQPGPLGNSDVAAYCHTKGIATNAPTVIPPAGDFTVMVWMRCGISDSLKHHLFSDYTGTAGMAIYVENGYFKFSESTVGIIDSGVVVGDWIWHLVGVSRQGDTFSLIVDGQVKTTLSAPGTVISPTDNWLIAADRWKNNAFVGYVADVKVYDTAFPLIDNPAQAPLPADTKQGTSLSPNLQWVAGRDPVNVTQINSQIKAHYLYGNFANPSNSNLTLIATLVPSDCNFGNILAEKLNLSTNTKYLWRIEEGLNNGSGVAYPAGDARNIQGVVWEFTTGSGVPIIVEQPKSMVAQRAGNAAFQVTVTSNSTASYTWYHSTDNTADTSTDDVVVGTNSNVLAMTNIQAVNEGYYFCKITNDTTLPHGTEPPVISNVVKLGVKRQLAYWKLNNTAADFQNGQYKDVCTEDPQANNAAVQGTAQFVTGFINDAINVDNENGWANCGSWNPSEYTSQLTVSAWVTLDGSAIVGNGPGIVSKWDTGHNGASNCWSLYLAAGNSSHPGDRYLLFSSWNSGGIWVNLEEINANEWFFVSATVDGNGIASVYVNGELKGQDTAWSFGPKTDAPLLIGRDSPDGYSYTGLIDDVKLYNYSLDELTIANQYYQLSGKKPCVQSQKPQFDFDNNCVVDFVDLAMLASHWLETGLYPDLIQ
jgi:hypothetical protein